MRVTTLSVLFSALTVIACSPVLPRPLVEPSAPGHVGDTRDVEGDVAQCREDLRKAAPVTMQPRWLPPIGPGNGPVLGTVDVPHPAWPGTIAYRQELERCLTSRGYQIRGWN